MEIQVSRVAWYERVKDRNHEHHIQNATIVRGTLHGPIDERNTLIVRRDQLEDMKLSRPISCTPVERVQNHPNSFYMIAVFNMVIVTTNIKGKARDTKFFYEKQVRFTCPNQRSATALYDMMIQINDYA